MDLVSGFGTSSEHSDDLALGYLFFVVFFFASFFLFAQDAFILFPIASLAAADIFFLAGFFLAAFLAPFGLLSGIGTSLKT